MTRRAGHERIVAGETFDRSPLTSEVPAVSVDPWIWLVFVAGIVAMLAVDLVVENRTGGAEPSLRRSAAWSVAWTAVALAFGVVVLVWRGGGPAEEYLTGFLLERSLSLDNLFVFAMLFSYFAVPSAAQRKVLFFGIVGAIVLRAVFIFAGAALLDAFHWTIYVFGALLLITGIRMATHDSGEVHPDQNPVLRLVRRVVPMTDEYDGERIFVRRDGRRMATPMFAALVLVATFDVIFAVDSIPAIFAVTRDTFTVFAANAFSLLGLMSLYFLLAGMADRFRYLNVGLAFVLVFIGVKMLLTDVWHMPTALSLGVIVGSLAVAVAASLRQERREALPGG
jgi:tellurite resistance protein TerC